MGMNAAAIKEKAGLLKARVEKLNLEKGEGREFTDYLEDNVKELYEELAEETLEKPVSVMDFYTNIALRKDDIDLLEDIEKGLRFVDTK